MIDSNEPYKVVICGGGLAGLTLSLQLKQQNPEFSITVIEKTERPLREAAHKVGESTVEIGAHYLSNTIGLKAYLDEKQFPKLGLRYFYGDSSQPFENRPELGPSMFSPVPTYQLDRGSLENDLREMVLQAGIQLLEGASLKDITINDGSDFNEITYSQDEQEITLSANWVVDAMGRRRYLQTKLGLKKESPHSASSVWFRLEGKVTVDDLVSSENKEWQNRNIEDRYYSTNHLMGLGYWVWLIPLSSGNTSIGIVTQNDLHDFGEYSRSYEKSFKWLEKFEPKLADHIKGKEPIDFRKIKNYSYGSKQLFSENGWSCVGESGIFSDPFYSPGSDMIAITNTFTANLIKSDFSKNLTADKVGQLNRFILETMFPDQLSYYTGGYHTFGNTQVASTKFLWDTLYYWRVYAHAFMSGIFDDFEQLKNFEIHVKQLSELNQALQISFKSWAESTKSTDSFSYADLARKGVFIESAISLLTQPKAEELDQHFQNQLEYFKRLKLEIEEHFSQSSMSTSTAFSEFHGHLSSTSKRKNKINRAISRIGNGAFLYSVRDLYINLLVRGKQRVNLSWILKLLYAK
ncbi:tryptophan 7-halogenase [Flavobacteriales bacterium]|nr:tryptophan 7-halogenase [Flavobacteriales bacterium]